MQVWDWAGGGFVRYSAADVSQQHMGIVAENSILQNAFLGRLSNLNTQTDFFWKVRIWVAQPAAISKYYANTG